MPQLMQLLGYIIYFWSNEGTPREPIHVHVAKRPTPNGTKIWILKDGSARLEHNRSQISSKNLKKLLHLIEEFHVDIEVAWKKHFDLSTITYWDMENRNFPC